MQLFDSHAHLADPAFDEDRECVLARMEEAGVRECLIVCDPCDEMPRVSEAFALAAAREGFRAAVGVHPHNASGWSEAVESALRARLAEPACACLGEIGLDYHYDLSPREVQREVFARQLDMAFELDMPAELHIREAFGDAMDILRAAARSGRLPLCGMHCFTGSWETEKECLRMGMYISFSGSVTFKNAVKLIEVAEKTPLERVLVETDCPYLAPVPHRGHRNEPAFVSLTAARVAQIRGMDPEELAAAAAANARRFLRIGEGTI